MNIFRTTFSNKEEMNVEYEGSSLFNDLVLNMLHIGLKLKTNSQ